MGLLPSYENALKAKFNYMQQESSPTNVLAKLKLQDYQQNNALDRAYTEEQRTRETEAYENEKKDKLISVRANAHLKALQSAQTDEDYKKIYLDSMGEFATDEDKSIDVKTYRGGQQIKIQVNGIEIDGPRAVLEDWYNTNSKDPTWSTDPKKLEQSMAYLQGKAGVTFKPVEGISKEDKELKKEQINTEKAQQGAYNALAEQRRNKGSTAANAKEKGISDSVINAAQKAAYSDAQDAYDKKYFVVSDELSGEGDYAEDAPDMDTWIEDYVDKKLDKYITRINKYSGRVEETEATPVAQGGTKTITDTKVNKKTGQTVTIYSDGTYEVTDAANNAVAQPAPANVQPQPAAPQPVNNALVNQAMPEELPSNRIAVGNGSVNKNYIQALYGQGGKSNVFNTLRKEKGEITPEQVKAINNVLEGKDTQTETKAQGNDFLQVGNKKINKSYISRIQAQLGTKSAAAVIAQIKKEYPGMTAEQEAKIKEEVFNIIRAM